MNPNTCPLHAGIAGVSLPIDRIDFGEGITFRKIYAHIMAPYLAAFAPADPGKPHPAPWKAVSGGMGFDIEAELYVPIEFSLLNWFDRVNTIWWFVALLRLKASNLATVPVIANKSFTEIPLSKDEPHFWPIEMKSSRLVPVDNPNRILNESDLQWICRHWIAGGKLMNENDDFNLAFQAIDQCIWSHSSSLALERIKNKSSAVCVRRVN